MVRKANPVWTERWQREGHEPEQEILAACE
jgi:hypothetical protein